MNGKVGAPKATKEVFAAVEEEVDRLIREGGGWDAGLRLLAEAGDPTTGPSLARNDWYRLRRALEIIKVLQCNGAPETFPSGHLMLSFRATLGRRFSCDRAADIRSTQERILEAKE